MEPRAAFGDDDRTSRPQLVGLVLLGLALAGAMVVVFGATAGTAPGILAGAATLVMFACLWLVFPFALRVRADDPPSDARRRP